MLVQTLTHVLESCDLHQYINVPTHYKGHTLDILISRDTSELICDVDVLDIGLCDNDGNLVKAAGSECGSSCCKKNAET